MKHRFALLILMILLGLSSISVAEEGPLVDFGLTEEVVVFQGKGVFEIGLSDLGWVMFLPDEFFTWPAFTLNPPIKLPPPPNGGGGTRPEDPNPECTKAHGELANRYAMLAALSQHLSLIVSYPNFSVADLALFANQINIVRSQIAVLEIRVNSLCS